MPLTVVRHEAVHLYAPPPATPAGVRAVNAILRLHKAEEDAIERARVAIGLTNSEFRTVRYLLQAARDGRDMGPKDVAIMLSKSNAAVTQVVDRLERLGYVERKRHASDRRAQVLCPTELAAERVDDAFRDFHVAIATAIGLHDDAEAEVVARVLDGVSERIGVVNEGEA